MPAKDIHHVAMRTALQQTGWTITHDPYFFSVGKVDFYIDLGAEQLIAAEKENQKIAIEVKSFIQASPVQAFHEAIGQFVNYRSALEEKEPQRKLFLAVPDTAYDDFFQRPFVQKMINQLSISLIIYDPLQPSIIQWIA